jgi:hypothetical protein
MVVDERSRHALFQQLERTIGEEAAATLMEHLPPVGWADVATRRDLDSLRAEMQGEFTLVRRDVDALRTEMQGEFKLVRQESKADIAGVRAEIAAVRTEMNGLRADFRGEISTAMTAQTRTIMFSMLGFIAANGGFILAVARSS